MILRGILASSLGGFVCVRGFAPLGDLARFSYSDAEFQRSLINRHRDDIAEFLRERDSVFFPEVILSCQLERMCQRGESIPSGDLLGQLINATRPLSKSVGGLTIKRQSGIKFQSERDTRITQQIPLATLTFDDEYWETLLARPLFRIDGNHRLSASSNNTEFDDYLAPFCVILFDANNNRRSYERTIFHTINSKVVPLTSEQNLRVILGDDTDVTGSILFSDDTLKSSPYFGWPYYFTRHLLRQASPNNEQYGHLSHLQALRVEPRSTLLRLFEFLHSRNLIRNEEQEIDRLFNTLRQIDFLYENESRLRDNHSKGLLIAFIFYQLSSPKLAEVFRHWVLSSHLYDIEEVEAKSLINIFDKIMQSRSRTIFVSMQFSNDTERHYDMIKKAVDEINQEFKPDIKLEEIRVDKYSEGHSYQITDEILRLIKDSGLLIADLSKSNINVYHEVGYLMGVNEGRGLPQENFILTLKKEPDGTTDKVGFNLQPWQQIRFSDTDDLKNQIKESILKYYQLR